MATRAFAPQLTLTTAPVYDPDPARLPRHIAIICDGNGRWAKDKGLPRLLGHHQGYQSVREVVRASSDIGIQALTLYAFSTENWRRPQAETEGLMRLFIEGARRELKDLHENNVQMRFSGRLEALPADLRKELDRHCALTHENTGLVLNVCLNYGGRAEIVDAARRVAERVARGELAPDQITEADFEQELYTAGLPDPDLLIRPAGDLRISNYLLWQIAYTEIYFTPVRWPDFGKRHLEEAIGEFQRRERRFGGLK